MKKINHSVWSSGILFYLCHRFTKECCQSPAGFYVTLYIANSTLPILFFFLVSLDTVFEFSTYSLTKLRINPFTQNS